MISKQYKGNVKMNKNLKIAKQLITLAKELTAEDEVNFVMNENGNVQQVDSNTFSKIFNIRIAAEQDYYKTTKAEILISPVVNATHPTSNIWYKDLVQKLKIGFLH